MNSPASRIPSLSWSRFLLRTVLVATAVLGLRAETSSAALDAWLKHAATLTSFEAKVVQIRHLKALQQPLTATGHVWFEATGNFRWELGEPPQSIALRRDGVLTLLSPRLRRAETIDPSKAGPGPARDLLGLLDVGFPRDPKEFRERFEPVGGEAPASGEASAERLRLGLRPRNAAARRLLPSILVELDVAVTGLRATEMTFADGSRLRTEFSEVVTNRPPDPGIFRSPADATWKVVKGGDRP